LIVVQHQVIRMSAIIMTRTSLQTINNLNPPPIYI